MKNNSQKKKQLQLSKENVFSFMGILVLKHPPRRGGLNVNVRVPFHQCNKHRSASSVAFLTCFAQAKPSSSEDLSRPQGTVGRKENIFPSAAESISDPGNLDFQAQLTAEQSAADISTSKPGRNQHSPCGAFYTKSSSATPHPLSQTQPSKGVSSVLRVFASH